MEEALFVEGGKRFSQTKNEPPMDHKVTKETRFWGQKEGVNHILQGSFDVNITKDECLHQLIKKPQKPETIVKSREETTQMIPVEHHHEWKAQKEETLLGSKIRSGNTG